MTTILAASFTAALGKLAADEQKQAKLTVFDLQTEPDRPGLQFHRIDASKDRNFWSVRVSRDVRIIVHKTGESLLLAYVGHHDDAYRWAERRRIDVHPRTGVVQLVEVRERVEEIPAAVPVAALVPAEGSTTTRIQVHLPRPKGVTAARLFARLGRDDLLGAGVPEDWIDDVVGADEDAFLALAAHLPAEASEALLDYVSSGTLRKPEPVAPGADPFAHPDTMRRFRILDDREELEAALDAPWDAWSVFLHPAQRSLVARTFAGPARVAGSAGTGKTVVALHRAVRLARANPEARVLLATFSEPLAAALARKLALLAGPERHLVDRIAVGSWAGVAEELHQLAFGRKPALASRDTVRSIVAKAFEAEKPAGLNEQFALSEWINVVDAWQVEDGEAYAIVPRMGRRVRLGTRQRAAIWPVFERIRSALAERHLMTPAGLFAKLSRHFGDREKPFDHIVIDEAQDLGVPELRFLVAIAPNQSDALFFAGDLGQRIFQQPFSWKGLGVDVRGRSVTLRVNYRTSHQIRIAADRLLPDRVQDADGNQDDRAGTVSVFNGPAPEVVVAASEEAETEAVAGFIARCRTDGFEAAEIGLFVRSRNELPRARAAAERAGLSCIELTGRNEAEPGRIAIGTMHAAKGLEFRAVVVMACDEAVIPSAVRMAEVSDEMELDEVYATERHLLYVAATRARDRLLITAVDPPSEFLIDLR
ncbi:MAG: AAA family ATPase [Bauldia sp.]|nr:AAA family ATPase [Bauldia sp.]MCW5716890.1 AAA family ATPase [Bauldia sp.]